MGSVCEARRRTWQPQPAPLTGTRSLQHRQLEQLANVPVKPPREAPQHLAQTRHYFCGTVHRLALFNEELTCSQAFNGLERGLRL